MTSTTLNNLKSSSSDTVLLALSYDTSKIEALMSKNTSVEAPVDENEQSCDTSGDASHPPTAKSVAETAKLSSNESLHNSKAFDSNAITTSVEQFWYWDYDQDCWLLCDDDEDWEDFEYLEPEEEALLEEIQRKKSSGLEITANDYEQLVMDNNVHSVLETCHNNDDLTKVETARLPCDQSSEQKAIDNTASRVDKNLLNVNKNAIEDVEDNNKGTNSAICPVPKENSDETDDKFIVEDKALGCDDKLDNNQKANTQQPAKISSAKSKASAAQPARKANLTGNLGVNDAPSNNNYLKEGDGTSEHESDKDEVMEMINAISTICMWGHEGCTIKSHFKYDWQAEKKTSLLQKAMKETDPITQDNLASLWEERAKANSQQPAKTGPAKSRAPAGQPAKKANLSGGLGVKNTLELLKNRIAREECKEGREKELRNRELDKMKKLRQAGVTKDYSTS